jgi:hypothetical protein
MRSDSESPDERIRASGLRVVSKVDEHLPLNVDLEIKSMLEDMKRRYRVMHERMENESDTPDAA